MKFDQAVRLRELWNASFNMNLRIRDERINECTLYVLKSELTVDGLRILGNLAGMLSLNLKENSREYVIQTLL